MATTEAIDPQPVREAAQRFRPPGDGRALRDAQRCTPIRSARSGTFAAADALYYVDFVAPAGGAVVDVDACHIDLGLLGSQKVLSLMPDLSMISVSERAWRRGTERGYAGYDALALVAHGTGRQVLPYTHNWQALAGLQVSLRMLLDEGLENVYARHAQAAAYCRQRLHAMNVRLFPVRRHFLA